MDTASLRSHPGALSKREVIEIPLGKQEPFLSPKLNQMCIDGQPHKSTGPAFIPEIVRSGDELAKRQGLLPAIDFHILKYSLGYGTPAIRCFPHAGSDESRPHKCPVRRNVNSTLDRGPESS